MSLQEKFAALTEEQKQELSVLTTAEEVLAFAKRNGIDLTAEETEELATLSDEDIGGVAGGCGPGHYWG